MTSQEIEAIAGGYHGDPFHVLGPHSVTRKKWEVRAFLPQAESAAVVLNETGQDAGPTTTAVMERSCIRTASTALIAARHAGVLILFARAFWDGREIEIS